MFFAVLLYVGSAHATTIHGRVVSVADGDTITLLGKSNQQHLIRLAEIDAPEKKQAFGEQSRRTLSSLIAGKHVEARCPSTDRYNRKICTIFHEGIDINEKMVLAGMAWVYRAYSRSQYYLQAEDLARKQKVGLWVDLNPTPPWEWRHRQE